MTRAPPRSIVGGLPFADTWNSPGMSPRGRTCSDGRDRLGAGGPPHGSGGRHSGTRTGWPDHRGAQAAGSWGLRLGFDPQRRSSGRAASTGAHQGRTARAGDRVVCECHPRPLYGCGGRRGPGTSERAAWGCRSWRRTGAPVPPTPAAIPSSAPRGVNGADDMQRPRATRPRPRRQARWSARSGCRRRPRSRRHGRGPAAAAGPSRSRRGVRSRTP
jgi:hypothetical protein